MFQLSKKRKNKLGNVYLGALDFKYMEVPMITSFDFSRFPSQDMKRCLNLIKKGLVFQEILNCQGQMNRELRVFEQANVDAFINVFLRKPNRYPYISCLLIGWLDGQDK